jgi:hypothetical protein
MFVITPTSDDVHCVKMAANFDYTNLANPKNWIFAADAGKTNAKSSTSFINDALNYVKWMHAIAAGLLFFSMISFKKASGTTLNFSSVLKIISVLIYITALFFVEQAIRKYRTVYTYSKDPAQFHFAEWKDAKKTGGSTCFFDKEGTAMLWLWIELYAFMGQILSILFDLIEAYFSNTVIQEPKNSDYIFVKDYRKKEGKSISYD